MSPATSVQKTSVSGDRQHFDIGTPLYSITPASRTVGGLGATGLVDLRARAGGGPPRRGPSRSTIQGGGTSSAWV